MALVARHWQSCVLVLLFGVAAAATSAQSSTAAPAVVRAAQALQPDPDNGTTIWDNACAACHGELGQGGHGGGPDIRNSPLSLSEIMLVVNGGRSTMPGFRGFSAQELLDVSSYVLNSL